MPCGARRSIGVSLTLPLKSLPTEQEVVGEVSVHWPWAFLCKLLETVAGSKVAETKDHLSLYRDGFLLNSFEFRMIHSEVNCFEQNKMGNPGEKEEEEKCLSYCSFFFYCPCT